MSRMVSSARDRSISIRSACQKQSSMQSSVARLIRDADKSEGRSKGQRHERPGSRNRSSTSTTARLENRGEADAAFVLG